MLATDFGTWNLQPFINTLNYYDNLCQSLTFLWYLLMCIYFITSIILTDLRDHFSWLYILSQIFFIRLLVYLTWVNSFYSWKYQFEYCWAFLWIISTIIYKNTGLYYRYSNHVSSFFQSHMFDGKVRFSIYIFWTSWIDMQIYNSAVTVKYFLWP